MNFWALLGDSNISNVGFATIIMRYALDKIVILFARSRHKIGMGKFL